jgi:membrane-bound lytic murein transglycosylase B
MEGVMRLALALLVAALAATSCSRDATSDAAPADLPAEAVAQGLCLAVADSGADPAAAEESFARVHSDLHVVARALQQVDRKVAGRLLVAKQQVEDDIRRRAPASELTPDLRSLITATEDGFVRLDVTVTPCHA